MRHARRLSLAAALAAAVFALIVHQLWALAIAFSLFIGFVAFVSYRAAGHIFDPILFLGAVYSAAFPLSVFLLPFFEEHSLWWRPERLDRVYLQQAMAWALFGFAMLVVGYFLFSGARKPRGQRFISQSGLIAQQQMVRLHWRRMAATVGFLALTGCVGLLVTYGGFGSTFIDTGLEASSMAQIFTTLAELRYGFFALVLVAYMRWKSWEGLKLLALALLTYQILSTVALGSKSPIFSLLLSFLLALAFVPKTQQLKLGWRQWLLIGFAAVVLQWTFSTITEFRIVARERYPQGYSFTQAAQTFVDVATGDAKSTTSIILEGTDPYFRISSRLAHLWAFTMTLQQTAGQPPYDNAWQAALIPLYAFVPRGLMPDKPHFYDSGDFARDYFGWDFGGVSLSLPGSLYWSWGLIGIPLGMLAIGMVLGALVSVARGEKAVPPHLEVIFLTLAVGMVIYLMDVGKGYSGLAFNLVRQFVFLWCGYMATTLLHSASARHGRSGSRILR